MRLISALLFTSSAVLAMGAAAQTRIYCCDDANGRKVCGDFLPTACQGRAYEERDTRGFVSKMVEAPLTAEQQARRDAEKARKDEEQKKAAEQRRRDVALQSTYSSEKDINSARDRALAEVEKNIKQARQRLDDANKKKQAFDKDKEFYKGKALPDRLKAQIRDNEKEITAQQAEVDFQVKTMDEVRSRFADEKKRYLELTGKKAAEATPGVAPAAESKPADKPVAAPAPAPAPVKPAAKK
ncbi:MAG: hypothetical protein Q8O52_09250 [Sulfuritalea sp.]|nr:hypothetical protein [Sulfuritalea sp.]